MKCIVTGGCGFLGSQLVESLLAKNHTVTIIDNLSTGNLDNIKKFKTKVKLVVADISGSKRIDKYFKNAD